MDVLLETKIENTEATVPETLVCDVSESDQSYWQDTIEITPTSLRLISRARNYGEIQERFAEKVEKGEMLTQGDLMLLRSNERIAEVAIAEIFPSGAAISEYAVGYIPQWSISFDHMRRFVSKLPRNSGSSIEVIMNSSINGQKKVVITLGLHPETSPRDGLKEVICALTIEGFHE